MFDGDIFMPTWKSRVAEFKTDKEPEPDQAVEVLCEDHNGTYVLPFLCRLKAGVWMNETTGTTVDATIVGWRTPRDGRRR
jgi:hypothetical protein